MKWKISDVDNNYLEFDSVGCPIKITLACGPPLEEDLMDVELFMVDSRFEFISLAAGKYQFAEYEKHGASGAASSLMSATPESEAKAAIVKWLREDES